MTQESLPFQGRTPQSRHTGRKAALAAAERRPSLQQRYLDLLAGFEDGFTDREAADAMCCPVSSICSTRAAVRDQLVTLGERMGPYGSTNTVWGLASGAKTRDVIV